MKILRRILQVVGLLFVLTFAFVFYGYATAEGRMKEVCSQIKLGMSISELRDFGAKHGLHGLGPRPSSGINFMVESRTFGRYGCKVTLEAGVVKNVEFNFAD